MFPYYCQMQRIAAREFIFSELDTPIIDVRSPSEFADGHIRGAVNIPVFSDKERAQVGTTYKQVGKSEAIEQGLELVGPKMKNLAQEAKNIAQANKLKVYCWRGGMRSEKMAWLFDLVGIDTYVLENGYKAYRACANAAFGDLPNLVVLQGPTGCGKTAILMALKQAGEQVIDLEGLAHHRGSAFGGLGMPDQPTTQQFQNDIFTEIKDFDLHNRIWIESESMSIGKVHLPEALWQSMNQARRVVINLSRENRLKRIVKEYGTFNADQLTAKIESLSQRLGRNNVKTALLALENQDIIQVAELLLKYYDKAYSYSADKYKFSDPVYLELSSYSPVDNAKVLIQSFNG